MSIYCRFKLLLASVWVCSSLANTLFCDIVKTILPNRITGATLLNYLFTHFGEALIHNNWEY